MMYRALPPACPVIGVANQQDEYRKHLSAASSAKSVIDTSAPPPNPRLAAWRKRIARERRMREALEVENGRQMRKTEKNQAQSRTAFPAREDFEDTSAAGDWIEDLPKVEAQLAMKHPQPLLQIRQPPKVVHPKNGHKDPRSAKVGSNVVKPITSSERIQFGAQGEIEVAREGDFDDDWETTDTSLCNQSERDDESRSDDESESDGGDVCEHCEAEAEDNEEEELRYETEITCAAVVPQQRQNVEVGFDKSRSIMCA
jgi:hypothetical protein